jgi:hypothetical protein
LPGYGCQACRRRHGGTPEHGRVTYESRKRDRNGQTLLKFPIFSMIALLWKSAPFWIIRMLPVLMPPEAVTMRGYMDGSQQGLKVVDGTKITCPLPSVSANTASEMGPTFCQVSRTSIKVPFKPSTRPSPSLSVVHARPFPLLLVENEPSCTVNTSAGIGRVGVLKSEMGDVCILTSWLSPRWEPMNKTCESI